MASCSDCFEKETIAMPKLVDGKKVWGSVSTVHDGPLLQVKKVSCNSQVASSWHRHERKTNGFFVESGSVIVQTRRWPVVLKPGQYYELRPGVEHRFVGVEPTSVMIEMYFAEPDTELSDMDIVRTDEGHLLPDEEWGLLIGMAEAGDD